jgi:SCY1-like protein 1
MAKKTVLSKTPINRSNVSMTQLHPAKHHYIHCKKLRHPYIIQVHATLDTDNPNESSSVVPPNSGNTSSTAIASSTSNTSNSTETGDYIIVTEPCIPFEEWVQKYNPTPEQIAWGLECIIKALHFLHTSSNGYCHGNIQPSSLYVTKAGDVKLWNFSLVTSMIQDQSQQQHYPSMSRHFMDYESWITPDFYRSPERKEKRWDAIIAGGAHIMDSYAFGVLIEHIFTNMITTCGGVPTKLVKAVQRLQTNNIKMRPKLFPLLKCPIFDTPYQKIQLQLEEIHVMNTELKITFWNNTLPMLQGQIIPELVAVYKLLPIIQHTINTVCHNDSMKTQDIFRREGT